MNKKGFTLIELIVVMTIIATLMTIGSFGISNFTKAKGVGMAVSTSQAIVSEAALIAKLNGTPPYAGGRTRLLIHTDSSKTGVEDRKRYLRFLIIQRLADDMNTPDEADDEWEFAARGTYLPDGGFYSVALSNQPDLQIPTVSVTLPGDADETVCSYYEFKGVAGISTLITKPGAGARFVISGGVLPPGAAEPIRNEKSGKKNVGGFMIWRNATTSTIRHPDQIGL